MYLALLVHRSPKPQKEKEKEKEEKKKAAKAKRVWDNCGTNLKELDYSDKVNGSQDAGLAREHAEPVRQQRNGTLLFCI